MSQPEALKALLAQISAFGVQTAFLPFSDSDLPLSALLETERLRELLGRYGHRYGTEQERRAVATQWSKHYFSRVVTPVIAAAILIDWRLPLSPEITALDIDADGEITALRVSSFGKAEAPSTSIDRFSFLTEEHLPLVVDAIAEASGLSRHVLWSNAGNLFEGVSRRLESVAPQGTAGIRDAMALLDTSHLDDGTRNPLFRPIVYADEARTMRKRRVCCARYLIPSLGFCQTCPSPLGVSSRP